MQKLGFLVLLLSSISGFASAQSDLNTNSDLSSLALEHRSELDREMLNAYEGDKDAQFRVGVLYTNNQLGSPDYEQAVYWYKQAARQGHVAAQYNLGHQYLIGEGVGKSEATAMKWWLEAAKRDHKLAQFNVGRAYYLGIGVEEDHKKSKYWFHRAAENNDPKSIEILTKLGWLDGKSPAPIASVSNEATAPKTSTAILPKEIDSVLTKTPKQQPEESELAIKLARDRKAAEALESKIIPIDSTESRITEQAAEQVSTRSNNEDVTLSISDKPAIADSTAQVKVTDDSAGKQPGVSKPKTSDSAIVASDSVSTTDDDRSVKSTSLNKTQQAKASEIKVIKRKPKTQSLDKSAKIAGGILVAPVTTRKQADNPPITKNSPIAVYTDPKVRSVLIAIIDSRQELSVTTSGDVWTEVKSKRGLPVWMHGDYLDVAPEADMPSKVTGDKVNARSVPLLSAGTVVGRLNKKDRVRVLEQRGKWYRVVGPERFTAWVKTAEFNALPGSSNAISRQDKTVETVKPEPARVKPALSRSDDTWFFKQKERNFTLQLGTFNSPDQAQKFLQRIEVYDDPLFHQITSSVDGNQQTTFLYGSYSSRKKAEKDRTRIKQRQAWIRTFDQLQENRCSNWQKHSQNIERYCK